MILTVGYNYVKLNNSPEFHAKMGELFPSFTFEYGSGEAWGYPAGTAGYEVTSYHFGYLPIGTRIYDLHFGGNISLQGGYVEKTSEASSAQPFIWVSGGGDMGTHIRQRSDENHTPFFVLGREYMILIPSVHWGTDYEVANPFGTIWPNEGATYGSNFRSDLMMVNRVYPPAGNNPPIDSLADAEAVGEVDKFRCGLAFLVPVMNREKSVLHKAFPDSIAEERNSTQADYGLRHYESYYVVYSGAPMPLQDNQAIKNLTTNNSDFAIPQMITNPDYHYANPLPPIPFDELTSPPEDTSFYSDSTGYYHCSYNILADISPGFQYQTEYETYSGLEKEYTWDANISAYNSNNCSLKQVPPGIVMVHWLGHTFGRTENVGTNPSSFWNDNLLSTGQSSGVDIRDYEFIGPSLTSNNTMMSYGSLIVGPWVDESGLNEFFDVEGNCRMHKEKMGQSGNWETERTVWYPSHCQSLGAYGPHHVQGIIGSQIACFSNKKKGGNMDGDEWIKPLSYSVEDESINGPFPEMYLQPGNIYRIDVRFPIGEGTMDLGPDFARVMYSDDPLGDSGLSSAVVPEQVGGYSRKSLEFLPFVRNGLTSWRQNPISSVTMGNLALWGDFTPVYFEDYNIVKYTTTPDTGTILETEAYNGQYYLGLINSVDAVQWTNVNRQDIAEEVMSIALYQAPSPPPQNPIYFEDFDQAGLTGTNEDGTANLNDRFYRTRGDGELLPDDVVFWAQLGRQDVADQISNFILTGNYPPSRADIGTENFPGSGNFGGGIFNLSDTMDNDYTTQLLQSGQTDTPDYIFQTLPNLPIQPWGLRYFEDFKAFTAMAMDFNGALVGGNALLNFTEDTYLTANMSDPHTAPITHIWDMYGNHSYRGFATGEDGSQTWYGNITEIQIGQIYDVMVETNQMIVFRNPFLENETDEYGPHTIRLIPGQYNSITFAPTFAAQDITFNEDDINTWQQIQNQTGEYTGHVQDWIRRYIDIREGGYDTNITTFNSTYLPKTGTGEALNGPLKPGYTIPPPMNQYPLIPNGMAYIEDFGDVSLPLSVRLTSLVNLGYPDLADWLATFNADPTFYNNMPPQSPLDDGLPVFGPKAIKQGLMTKLSFSNHPGLTEILPAYNPGSTSRFMKLGVNARWRPVPGQSQIFPFSSGSYDIEYVMDDLQLNNQVEAVTLGESFTIFGSSEDENGNYQLNPSEVAVFYKGNDLPLDDDNHIDPGWYAPRTSPIFDNFISNKPYYIQHQLPHSIYYIGDGLDLGKILEEKPPGTIDIYSTHNAGICPPDVGIGGKPYVELAPRVLTEIYFKPIPGPMWYPPDMGDGFINEWMYHNGFPILREDVNSAIPYLRDSLTPVADVINHMAFPKGLIAAIVEIPLFNEDGTYIDNIWKYLMAPTSNPTTYVENNYTAADWTGPLLEFKPGRKYSILVWSAHTEGLIWPFFGNLGNMEMDNNYFPTMPVNVDEWQDFDIDGDGIITINDWEIWQNPPSGPARQDIADYIQGWLTTKDWLIYFNPEPTATNPAFSQVNLEDINIPLVATDGQKLTSINEIDVTLPYFGTSEISNSISGNEIFTASMDERRKDYYVNIMNAHMTSSKSDYIFSVTYGHYQGSGSYIGVNNIGASEGIYKQHLMTLQDVEKLELDASISGYTTSSTRGFNISSGSKESINNGKPGIDDYVYIISFNRNKFGDKLKTGNWQLRLSGSNANGTGDTIYLTDDSQERDAIQTPAGPRYNIMSGSKGTLYNINVDGNNGVLGWFYPHQGTMILSEKLASVLPGPITKVKVNSTASVSKFSAETDGYQRYSSSGFFISPGQSGDKDYRNSLRLVNMMRNVGSNAVFDGLTGIEEQTCVTYMCNVKSHQLNFSNNPTYTSYEYYENTASVDFQPFFNMRNAQFHGDPQTYITQVNLHDEIGNVLATAKLSKPLNKNFDKEGMIKVKLTY